MNKPVLIFIVLLCFYRVAISADVHNLRIDTVPPPNFQKIDREAFFEDGSNSWQLFLTKNVQGNIPAKNNAPVGKYLAVARFIVNTDGTVNDISITQNPGYGTGEELERVIKLSSGKWKPALQNNKPIKAYKVQPLTFEVKGGDANRPLPNLNIVRNYSFESFDCYNQPIGWRPQITKPNACLIKLNTDDVKDGSCAISISSNPSYSGEVAVGLFNTAIMGNILQGKDSVKVSAWVKTKNVTDGVASIWMQLNGQEKIIRDINFDKTGLTGNTDWTKIQIALPLSPDVVAVVFGCKFTGRGEAVYDNFKVFAGETEIK